MKNMFSKRLILFIGAALFFSDIPFVNAQEVSEEFTLEEITVTAQKREENQQKVAMTMDVVSSEEIQDFGKNNINEILSGLSSTIIQKAADGYRVSMRGMVDTGIAQNGQQVSMPTVAINTDGVYSNRKDSAAGLFDLERVEVLYGPQSTMYSSNSPGGIVNVVTAQPKIDQFEASGILEVGNYALLHTEGVLNAPIGNKTALRAAFTTSKRDAYLDNGSDDENKKTARLRALFQASDSLSFSGTAEISKDTGAGFGGGVEAFYHQDDVDDPWTGAESDNLSSNDVTSKKFYGQMSWDTGIGSLSITPSYSTRNGDNTRVSQSIVNYDKQLTRESSAEARMTSSSDFFFKWIVGATYYDYKDDNRNESETYIETGVGTWRHQLITEEVKAFYGNITYPVTDTFRTTLGYRRSWDDLSTHNVEDQLAPGASDEYEHKDEAWTSNTNGSSDYKLGIEYDLAENSMIYADFSTSYRAQGMGNERSPETPIEKLRAYTVGAKNRFMENKLQLNASAYYYDYRNFSAGGPGNLWLYDTDNDLEMDDDEYVEIREGDVGDGYVTGFDIQTSMIITAKDMLNLSVSYTHSEWTELYIDYDEYDYTLKVVNDELVRISLNGDYSGKPLMSTPPWTVALTYNHNFNLSNGGVIKAGISSKIRSSYKLTWDDYQSPYDYQEGYHMENVNAVYTHPTGKWTLSAYVNNIFNYAEKVMYLRGPVLSIGDPRTYGTVLSVKF